MAEGNPLGDAGVGGLDQTMRLRAALEDEVTPNLDKIERRAKATSAAMKGMADEVEQVGESLGTSTSEAADKSVAGLNRIADTARSVRETYQEFGQGVTQSSHKIAQAVEDSLYTGKAESRMQDVTKDMGRLDKTMRGMADTQKSVSSRARRITNTARDTLNKKVIPSFQELHGTLDDYPDTLEDITQAEQDRLEVLEKSEGVLKRVTERVSEFSEKAKGVYFGAKDAAGIIAGSAVGLVGREVQQQQKGVAEIVGTGQWEQIPLMLEEANIAAKTSMGNIEGIVGSIAELQSANMDTLPELAKDMYAIQKVTGLAGEEMVVLHDQMARIAGIKGDDISHMIDMVAVSAQQSTGSMKDMLGVLESATEAMMHLGDESRKAFAASSMAAAAQTANMGVGANFALDLRERLLDDPSLFNQVQGQFTAVGMDLQTAIQDPELLVKGFQDIAQNLYGGIDIDADAWQRELFKRTPGVGNVLTAEEFRRFQRGETITGTGAGATVTPETMMRAEGTIEAAEPIVRGTAEEQWEQAMGRGQTVLMRPGRALMEGAALALEEINKHGERSVNALLSIDTKLGGLLSKAGAAGVGVAASIPLLKGLSAMIGGGGSGKSGVLGLGGVSGMFGGGGYGSQSGGGGMFGGGEEKKASGWKRFLGGTAAIGGLMTAADYLADPEGTVEAFTEDPLKTSAKKAGYGAAVEGIATLGEKAGVPRILTEGLGVLSYSAGRYVSRDKEAGSLMDRVKSFDEFFTGEKETTPITPEAPEIKPPVSPTVVPPEPTEPVSPADFQAPEPPPTPSVKYASLKEREELKPQAPTPPQVTALEPKERSTFSSIISMFKPDKEDKPTLDPTTMGVAGGFLAASLSPTQVTDSVSLMPAVSPDVEGAATGFTLASLTTALTSFKSRDLTPGKLETPELPEISPPVTSVDTEQATPPPAKENAFQQRGLEMLRAQYVSTLERQGIDIPMESLQDKATPDEVADLIATATVPQLIQQLEARGDSVPPVLLDPPVDWRTVDTIQRKLDADLMSPKVETPDTVSLADFQAPDTPLGPEIKTPEIPVVDTVSLPKFDPPDSLPPIQVTPVVPPEQSELRWDRLPQPESVDRVTADIHPQPESVNLSPEIPVTPQAIEMVPAESPRTQPLTDMTSDLSWVNELWASFQQSMGNLVNEVNPLHDTQKKTERATKEVVDTLKKGQAQEHNFQKAMIAELRTIATNTSDAIRVTPAISKANDIYNFHEGV